MNLTLNKSHVENGCSNPGVTNPLSAGIFSPSNLFKMPFKSLENFFDFFPNGKLTFCVVDEVWPLGYC